MLYWKGLKKGFLSIYRDKISAHFDFFMRVFLIAQAAVAVLLIISILLQNRGSGLGAAFGGDFGGYYTKRGLEKFFLYATVVFAIIFFILGIINVRLSIG